MTKTELFKSIQKFTINGKTCYGFETAEEGLFHCFDTKKECQKYLADFWEL